MKTKKNTDRSEQFYLDLKFGKYAEAAMKDWIIDFVSKEKKISYLCNSDDEFGHLPKDERKIRLKEYDLKFDIEGTQVLFEVKADKYDNSGNLIFEYKDNGKSSGVFVTKSDYFVYFFPRFFKNNVYIIKSEKLLELLSEPRWKHYLNYGGDLGTTANFKIAKDEFNDEFIKAGGLIKTVENVSIPSEFNLTRF